MMKEIFQNNKAEINKINKKRLKRVASLITYSLSVPKLFDYNPDDNLYMWLNLNVPRTKLNDLVARYDNIKTNKYAKNIVRSINNKLFIKNKDLVHMSILLEVVDDQAKYMNEIEGVLKNNINMMQQKLKENKIISRGINVNRQYENNLMWNGIPWQERYFNVLNNISLAILTKGIIPNFTNAKLNKQLLNNQIEKRLSDNTIDLISSETSALNGNIALLLYELNGYEAVVFRSNDDTHTCDVCSQHSDEIFKLIDAPQLPLHTRGRCWYEPVDSSFEL